jgi:hypothetical protein
LAYAEVYRESGRGYQKAVETRFGDRVLAIKK